ARRDQSAERTSKAAYSDLTQERAHDRQVQQHFVEIVLSSRIFTYLFDAEPRTNSTGEDDPPFGLHEGAQPDRNTGGKRERDAETGKEIGENRDDPLEQGTDDQNGHANDSDRIDQGRLHGSPQADSFFYVNCQALQDDVENTAGFAGFDHVRGEVVENDRILTHGIGQRGAAFNGGPDTGEGFLEGGIFLIGRQNFQTLDQRQASVDHDGELAEEDRNVLGLDRAG